MSGEQYQGKQYQDNRRDNGGQYRGNHGQGNQGGEGAGFFDLNHVRMTGTVQRFDVVNTKTGTDMIRFALRCYRERAHVVAFKDLAATTMLRPGDRVEVTGFIQTTKWTDNEGNARTGWQIVARTIGPEQARQDHHGRREGQGQRPHHGPGRNHRPADGVFGLRGDGQDGRQQRLPGTTGATWSRNRPGVMDYQGGPF